jgi:ABC-2 type transport system permease protein
MHGDQLIIVTLAVLVLLRIGLQVFRKSRSAKKQDVAPAQVKKPLSPWQRRFFTVFIFAKLNTRRYFRDKTAIFFTVLFPLIFLFVFGGIFGGSSGVSFKVALINHSDTPSAMQLVHSIKHSSLFKVSATVTTLSEANNDMEHGSLDAAIVLPSTFGVQKHGTAYPSGQAVVDYSQNNQQAAETATTILQAQFKGVNAQLLHTPADPFTAVSKQTGAAGLSAFDYAFTGLLGFSILGLGIFGPVNIFPELKKQGILRRFHTTPLRVWQYFLAIMLSQAVIGLLTMTIMLVVAIAIFHLKVIGNYAELAAFIVFSIVMILGIGLAVGGWAKNERQAAPVGNLISFPMMFLSGTFFPRYDMPTWLQGITNYLPLTPVIDGARLIAVEGKSLLEIGPQLAVMGVWLIIIYAIAFRVFRWE